MTTEPNTPPARLVDPIMAGYFLALLEKNGQITVEDWNKGVALGEKHSPEPQVPAFRPRPPAKRSELF